MKKLHVFAKSHGLHIVTIKYKHAAAGVYVGKGYDLINVDSYVHVSIEPHRSSYYADKWLVHFNGVLSYQKNMSSVLKYLNSIQHDYNTPTGMMLRYA